MRIVEQDSASSEESHLFWSDLPGNDAAIAIVAELRPRSDSRPTSGCEMRKFPTVKGYTPSGETVHP